MHAIWSGVVQAEFKRKPEVIEHGKCCSSGVLGEAGVCLRCNQPGPTLPWAAAYTEISNGLALHNITLNRQLLEMHYAGPAISQNKQG